MTPPPSQPKSAADRKREIVRNATRVFAHNGFCGTTSPNLAEACAVSEALIYKLFGSKQGLYQAILADQLETWEPITVDPASPAPLAQILREVAEQLYARVGAAPDFIRLLYYSELRGSEVALRFQEARGALLMAQLSELLRRRAERRELRGDLDPQLCASHFLCLTWNSAIGRRVFERPAIYTPTSDEQAIEHLVAIFHRGLQP